MLSYRNRPPLIKVNTVNGGSAVAPAITVGNELNSGLYRIGPNNLGLAIAGNNLLDMDANRLKVSKGLTTALANNWTAQQIPLNGNLIDSPIISWDADVNGQVVAVLMANNRIMDAPANIKQFALYMLRVEQDVVGSHVLSWNAAFKFGAAGAPTLSTAGGAVDWLMFIGGVGGTLEFLGARLSAI